MLCPHFFLTEGCSLVTHQQIRGRPVLPVLSEEGISCFTRSSPVFLHVPIPALGTHHCPVVGMSVFSCLSFVSPVPDVAPNMARVEHETSVFAGKRLKCWHFHMV